MGRWVWIFFCHYVYMYISKIPSLLAVTLLFSKHFSLPLPKTSIPSSQLQLFHSSISQLILMSSYSHIPSANPSSIIIFSFILAWNPSVFGLFFSRSWRIKHVRILFDSITYFYSILGEIERGLVWGFFFI